MVAAERCSEGDYERDSEEDEDDEDEDESAEESYAPAPPAPPAAPQPAPAPPPSSPKPPPPNLNQMVHVVHGAHRGLVPQLAGGAAGAPTNSALPAGVGESVPTSPFAHLPPVPVGEPDLYCYEMLEGVGGAGGSVGGSSVGRVSGAREQGTPLHEGRRNDDEDHAQDDAHGDGAQGSNGPAGASTALSGVAGAGACITSVPPAAGAPATALRRDELVVGERLTDALRTQLYEAVLRDQSRPRQSPLGGSTGGGGGCAGQLQLDLPSVGLKVTANSSARARQSSGGGGGGKGTGSAAKRDLAAAPTPLSTAKQGARGERSADQVPVAAKGAATGAAPKPKRTRGGNTGDENPYGKHYADSHNKRRRGSADARATTPSVKAEGEEEAGFD